MLAEPNNYGEGVIEAAQKCADMTRRLTHRQAAYYRLNDWLKSLKIFWHLMVAGDRFSSTHYFPPAHHRALTTLLSFCAGAYIDPCMYRHFAMLCEQCSGTVPMITALALLFSQL